MKNYDYSCLERDIEKFAQYSFLTIKSIGFSCCKRKIYAIEIGKGKNCVLYNASHHGNEWITTCILMRWLEELCEDYTHSIYSHCRLLFVPMVNPDGIEKVIHGNLSDWKANERGVDLNRNYNAGFKRYRRLQKEMGIDHPCAAGYSGRRAYSEPESKALMRYTKRMQPKRVYALHTQGEVIYYQSPYWQDEQFKMIAEKLSMVSGYELENEPPEAAYNGYNDWFIKKYHKPGFTIEVGSGVNPLPIETLDEIYLKIRKMLYLTTWI